MPQSTSVQAAMKREMVSGLDTLRFFAALSVVTSHLAANIPFRPATDFGSMAWHMIQHSANGRVAVALFFVLSGFCIHWGQVESLQVNTPLFIVRRGTRIGLPLVTASLLAKYLGSWVEIALQSVLWSVYCELIYYAIYPALLALRRRVSMQRIFATSSAIAAAGVILGCLLWPRIFGGVPTVSLYCPLLFPLWILGALLAERHCSEPTATSALDILCWRAGALTLCFLANQIRLYELLFASWLLYGLVGTFSYHYLPKELARWGEGQPLAITERLGKSSYSLYLVHPPAIAVVLQLGLPASFPIILLAGLFGVPLITFCFYTLCEAPAHRLARSVTGLRKSVPGSLIGA